MVEEKIRTNVYLNKEVKEEAKNIYKEYGISLSDAINIFLKQSVMSRGLPFDMKIPNTKTIKAMEDVRSGKNIEKVSLKDL